MYFITFIKYLEIVQYSLEKKQKDKKFRLYGLNMHKLYTLLNYQNNFSMKTRPLSGIWEIIDTAHPKGIVSFTYAFVW